MCIWVIGFGGIRRWIISVVFIFLRFMMVVVGMILIMNWMGVDKLLILGWVQNRGMNVKFLIFVLVLFCGVIVFVFVMFFVMIEKLFIVLCLVIYNILLYFDDIGGLIKELEGDSEYVCKIVVVLQQVCLDLVLLNEFDFDDVYCVVDLFQKCYLEVVQFGGGKLLYFVYCYLVLVNIGVFSGLDLDNNGVVGGEGCSCGNDVWGYGLYLGQYGMLVLLCYLIDEIKVCSFQLLKWSVMFGVICLVDLCIGQSFYNDYVWFQLCLFLKLYWDVLVKMLGGVVYVLVLYLMLLVFDGLEKCNVVCNYDELCLWQEYLFKGEKLWLCDDKGQCGGLVQDVCFVIFGDLNNDLVDGDGCYEVIVELIENMCVLCYFILCSVGGEQISLVYVVKGIECKGVLFYVIGDFGLKFGIMCLDYVLFLIGFEYVGSGVFWLVNESLEVKIVDGSDYYLVWVDVKL